MPPASPGVVVDASDVDLDVEGDWDSLDIQPSGIIDVLSSLRGDFSLIQECDEFLISRPSNVGAIFRLALCGLKTLDVQSQTLSCIDGLCYDAPESVGRVQSLEIQVATHSTELALVHGEMNRLKESIEVAQRQVADAQ